MSVAGLARRPRQPRCPPPSAPAPPTDKQAYKAALGFEQVLLGQLVQDDGPKAGAARRRPVRRDRCRTRSPTALVGGRRPRPRPSSSTRTMQERREHGPRGRAARPPRHADRLGAPAARARPRAGRGDPRPRRRRGARAARRHPDRDGPPRRARAGPRRRCCSAPAPRSASRPPRSRSSACARSSPPAPPQPRRERSAELRGLLAEIAREHGINRALMRQELAFLSHLTRLDRQRARAGLPARRRSPRQPGATAPPAYRALDLQA